MKMSDYEYLMLKDSEYLMLRDLVVDKLIEYKKRISEKKFTFFDKDNIKEIKELTDFIYIARQYKSLYYAVSNMLPVKYQILAEYAVKERENYLKSLSVPSNRIIKNYEDTKDCINTMKLKIQLLEVPKYQKK